VSRGARQKITHALTGDCRLIDNSVSLEPDAADLIYRHRA
jgi:hypothetical protein